MSTKGIIKVKADLSNYNKNRGIVELNKLQNSFTVLIDEECLGHNTTNKQSILNQVKWLIIKQSVWTNLLKEYSPSQKADLYFFESIKSSESITHIYQGTTASINIKELDYKITDGDIYLLIPFVNYPEYNKEASIRFVYLAKPKVRYCYFELKELNEFEKEHSNGDFYYYGEPVIIKGSFHLIPDFRLENENVEAYIDIIDNENKSQILDSIKIDIPKYITNASYNLNFSFSIIIKEKWRDLLNHHQQQTKQLALIIRFRFPDNSSKEIKNYNSIIDFEQWRELDAENNIWNNIPMTGSIRIPYENYQVILDRLELSRTNQISKIGDVNYTIKENNPCGFERIYIKDLEDEKRSEFLFFDEQELVVNDQTLKSFDVIRGDNESKNINIRIEGLTNLTGACQHILLNTNESHADIKNLINFDKITPAIRAQTNFDEESLLKKYINDNIHSKQDNTKNANKSQQNYEYNKRKDPTILKSGTKNNNYEDSGYEYEKSKTIENDYDLKAGHEKIAGASILGWKEGVNYKRTQTGSTALLELTNLKYKYNKTFAENISKGLAQDVINSLWCFNYFTLSDQHIQTYFVPISTCRYPNQILKIRLLPQIEWTFHLNYGLKNPLYYRDTWVEMRQHRVEAAFNKGQASDIDGYDGELQTTFQLALECKWNKTNTIKYDQKIADNIQTFVGTFLKIKKFVDKVTGKEKGDSTEGLSANLLERVKRTPLSIEITSPKLGIAAGWKYDFGRKEENTNHLVAPNFEIKTKADPLIGSEATIDLIAWGKKLHPSANAVITALDLMAYAANAEVRFDLIFYGKLKIEGNISLSTLKKEGQLKAEGQFGFKLILKATATGKLQKYFISADIDFEAKAEAHGYFSAGLSLGLDDFNGYYFKPTISHSGIKITYSFYVKINGYKRIKSDEKIIIKGDKSNIDQKYYINK